MSENVPPEQLETYRVLQDRVPSALLLDRPGETVARSRAGADLTLVVPTTARERVSTALTELGYVRTDGRQDDPSDGQRRARYERVAGDRTVVCDTAVGSVESAATGAEWPYEYLSAHSSDRPLGVDAAVELPVPEPALLFALELHGDHRDDADGVLALAADTAFDRVERHLYRGDPAALAERIEQRLASLDERALTGTTTGETVERLRRYLWSKLDSEAAESVEQPS